MLDSPGLFNTEYQKRSMTLLSSILSATRGWQEMGGPAKVWRKNFAGPPEIRELENAPVVFL